MYERRISANQREEAVEDGGVYRILDDAGITVMRVGLKSTDIIGRRRIDKRRERNTCPAFQAASRRTDMARDEIEPAARWDYIQTRSRGVARSQASSLANHLQEQGLGK